MMDARDSSRMRVNVGDVHENFIDSLPSCEI